MNPLAWLEADMARHMLVEIPLIVAAGAGLARFTPAYARTAIARVDAFGLSGWLFAGLVMAFWMIPAALDAAVASPAMNTAKFASLSAARLTHLMSPELTGLPAFLAVDAPGSSGVLITEYLAADALARLRADAAPAVLGTVAISRGLEEHASFAWQASGQARHAVFHLRTVLALEWLVAERALRMKGIGGGAPLAGARALAADWDPALEDRPLGDDAERAVAALPALAAVVRSVIGGAPH